MSRKLDRARVARYVEARRGVIGLTQRELAERAGVDIKTINNLESGERWPQVKTRAAVERELQWSTGDLLRIAEGNEPTSVRTVPATAGLAAMTATAQGVVRSAEVGLIRSALQRIGETDAWAAARAGVTELRWRQVTNGTVTADATELARMASAVGLWSGEIRKAGRADVANRMQDLELDEKYGDKTAAELDAESFEILERIKRAIEHKRDGLDETDQRIVDDQATGLAKALAAFRRRRDAS